MEHRLEAGATFLPNRGRFKPALRYFPDRKKTSRTSAIGMLPWLTKAS